MAEKPNPFGDDLEEDLDLLDYEGEPEDEGYDDDDFSL